MGNLSQRANVRAARARLAEHEGGTELEYQATITDLLDLLGWKWHHETDSRRTHPGWPDLFAIHPNGWALWLEVKSATGAITEDQIGWLKALGWNPGTALTIKPKQRRLIGLARPRDWDALSSTIGRVSQAL